jgi:NAD(P)-dependent dehydrogenase (short-subunit alcohol dehydrogenase family)
LGGVLLVFKYTLLFVVSNTDCEVLVLFAREGADVSITYLPEEEEDAQATKKMIEKEGRKANLMTLDLLKRENCQKAVQGHIDTFGKLNILVNNGNFLFPPSPLSSFSSLGLQDKANGSKQRPTKKSAKTSKTSTSTS